jgi:hypothetical protein
MIGSVVAALLSTEALVLPSASAPMVVQQQVVPSSPAAAPIPISDRLFPSALLVADKDAAVSPAKAKIEKAKAAAAEKAAAGGFQAPEAKAFQASINIPMGGNDDPFKEANELRRKMLVLKEKAGSGKLSKSQSAQLQQLKTMEGAARAKAQAMQDKIDAKTEKAATKEAGRDVSGGSYVDALAKVTGFSL